VVTGVYRDLFAATASAGAALTGLLFVAMTVASQRTLVRGPRVIRQIRASAALLAFTSTLAIALFGLVPGTNIGYPAVIVAAIGIFFIAAAIRSIVGSRAGPSLVRSQVWLILILLLICVAELAAGVVLLGNPASTTSLQTIGYAVVSSLLVGIGRAWEFIGERDSGIFASLGILVGHTDERGAPAADDGGPDGPGGAISRTADRRDEPEAHGDAPAGDPAERGEPRAGGD
jgi:hypothetical protein